MGTENTTTIEDRKAMIADMKAELEEEMVADIQASTLLVAPPELDREIAVFNEQDVEAAMAGRNWNHETVRWTKSVCANVMNHIVNYGVLAHACLSQGVSYRTLELLVKQYPGFAEMKAEALELYRDKVRRAVHNRAITGWLEPQFHQGQFCGYVRKFSDRMLELQAKRVDPEFRDKSVVDMNVAGGVLCVSPNNVVDKEKWLEEMRQKRKQIASKVVDEGGQQ